jgi:hypothetical protein
MGSTLWCAGWLRACSGYSGLLRLCSGSTQACSPSAQVCSPSAQVKAAVAQVWRLKRNQRKRKLILSLGVSCHHQLGQPGLGIILRGWRTQGAELKTVAIISWYIGEGGLRHEISLFHSGRRVWAVLPACWSSRARQLQVTLKYHPSPCSVI